MNAQPHRLTGYGLMLFTTAALSGFSFLGVASPTYRATSAPAPRLAHPIASPMACTNLSFSAAVAYPVGATPDSMAAGDFNGDGKLDLATINDRNGVSVLLGTGTGTFGPARSYSTQPGNFPQSVAAGDFNVDGKLDLMTANSSENISVLLGTGTGTFGPARISDLSGGASEVTVGDFNGDGKPDLATAGFYSAAVLLGDGTGSFSNSDSWPTKGTINTVTSGDFNGDQHLDLAAASSSAIAVLTWLGDGTGHLTSLAKYGAGQGPHSLATADLNGDGKPDLAAADGGGNSVSVLLGTGTGTFGATHDFAVASYPVSLQVGDFNGDSKLDLATANRDSNNMSVLLGTGTGTFGAARNFVVGSRPEGAAAGDFNGDGYLDLASANGGGNSISVLLNSCASPTSTPTATAQPSPTRTATVQPSPTPCAVPFTDIVGNPFETFIRALYCRGVVEGYADHTFRPYTDSDRGTLARWVVKARGWATDLTGAPHFTDVPPTDPLYPYVETAFNHGVLSGYADHTFRPANPVTRGQMSKMVVNAVGWPNDIPTGTQDFRDVDIANPFYWQIESIYRHSLVAGYDCGTGCREFRWGNNNTRGQLSKVLANALTAP